LQLGNGGTSGAINGDVGDNGTLLFDRSDAISFTGVISGSGALVKNGSDTLTLSGANSYGGGTAINAGSVAVGNNSALGTGMVVMAAGTTVVFANSSLTLANAFSLNGDPTYTVASGSTDTLGGVIADGSTPGELVLNGGGTLVLAGTNTYSGGTTISAGTLQGDTSSLQGNITDNAALVFNQNSKGTFAGVISGSGELIQGGSGTVILTGANSYSGGTTINAGTLQGDTTSLQGSITDNAALVFNQTTDGSFIGAISGSGTLSKIGTGLLVLDGNNPFTGSTTVQSGTLEVGDAATPSATLGGNVIVAAGGTLRGYGTIGGNVINSGTLWAGGSIGALTVQGNYIQNVGSLLNLDATPSGGASLLTVGGKATILSGSAVVLAQAGNWAPQTSYAILTAAGGITGQFTSASSSLLFLNPMLSYTTNAVNLSLERNDISLASVAQTPNQRAVANGTDNLGFGNPVYSAVTTLDDAATARHAFDQLSGVIHASTSSALIDDSRYVRDAINRHLLGLDNDGIQGSTDDGVSAWTSAWGHGGRNDDDSNVPALQANGSGVLVGADLPLGADARLGGVLGHGQNSIQTNSVGASSNVLGKHAGLYGSGTFGAFALRAGAVYSWQDVRTNRTVAFGNVNEWLTSEHDAQTAQAYVEGSYQFNVSPGQRLEPFVNVARVRVHEDALQEGGGAAALAVAGNSVSVNTATLGLRDTLSLDAAGGIHAHASLGWRQAWGDLTPIATTRFVDGGDSFAIAGMPVARDALNADLGIDFKIAKNVTVDASYLGQFASKVQDQGARMSLTVTF
jgi:fibronectin-binding autotransporter adhesin